MAKIYHVDLTEEERRLLLSLAHKGRPSARQVRRAQILLAAADGHRDAPIARMLHSSVSTVERTRRRFVEQGLEAALRERPRPGARRKLDGKPEAVLSALARGAPPHGRECRTMQLLADRLVELGIVEGMSDGTVRRALKKPGSNPG